VSIVHRIHVANNPDTLLVAALEYAARGWSIISVKGKVAACLWKPFQSRPADEPTLRRMFGRKGISGLAVILGSASGGLACRDFDDDAAYRRWATEHPDLASTLPTVKTARGFHVYFAGPDEFHDLGDGEYRGDAKHYCLLPPSLHPDGPSYTWLVPLPDGELPALDPVQAGLLTLPLPTQADTQAHPPHSLHVSAFGTEDAISATLPTGPGQRNRRIFALARRLKAIMPTATTDELEPIVRQWHVSALPIIRTKDWLESWIDFRTAWARVRKPVGETMTEIVAIAKARVPVGADIITKLVAVCQSLQEHHGPGQPWPLSCRMAAGLIGVGHSKAARLLKMLVIEGTIELVAPGGVKGSKIAAEYRFPLTQTGGTDQ
jgi:hypothetical protein